MRNFFTSSRSNENSKLIKEVYQELDRFYRSFFNNIYNELNIVKYRQIRDAIGLVMRKFESQDHPLSYTGKLVMYIQANVLLQHLHLTDEQHELLKNIAAKVKNIDLNFVYSGPLTDFSQFSNI